MSLDAYPSTLPGCEIGAELQPNDPAVRTQFEFGNTRDRVRTAVKRAGVTVNFYFTRYELEIFDAWWWLTLEKGTKWFTIDLPLPSGLENVEAKFTQVWKSRLGEGLQWPSVQAVLQIRDRTMLSAEQLAVATAYDWEDLLAGGESLHTLIHTDLPGSMTW